MTERLCQPADKAPPGTLHSCTAAIKNDKLVISRIAQLGKSAALKAADFTAKRGKPGAECQSRRGLSVVRIQTGFRMSRIACPPLVLAIFGIALATTPAAAEVVKARYSVSLIGLRIGEANAIGAIERAAYRVDLNARLTGIAAWLAHVKMALASSGEIRNGVVLPTAYATTSANSYETRTVRMSLKAGTVRAVEISPPFDDREGRVPVTAANKRNVLDPTSALIMAVPAGEPLVGPAACNRTLPIYDGVVRFDVMMSYAGTRNVSVKGYSGPVSVCTVRYRPVAGHRFDSRATRFMAENREIEVWLAPVEPAHVVVPFHVAMRTLAGMAEIDAVEFSVEPDSAAKAER